MPVIDVYLPLLSFVELPSFSKVREVYLDDDEFLALQEHLIKHPEDGDVIPQSGGCRKLRWAGSGRGRRGGLRVIYFLRLANGQIVLLTLYAENAVENMRLRLCGHSRRRSMKKLAGKALADFERGRDLDAELLQAAKDMRAGRWARKTEFLPRKDGSVLRRITLRSGKVEKEQVLAANDPAAARAKTGLSQARFAAVLGVSTRTLQEWEQGRRQPTGAARALLTIASRRPDVIREVLAADAA